MLFLGVVEHLRRKDLGHLAFDMRLSVYDKNRNACKLYEKLGFVRDGRKWNSELSGWDRETSSSRRGSPDDDSGRKNFGSGSKRMNSSGPRTTQRGEKDQWEVVRWRRYRRLNWYWRCRVYCNPSLEEINPLEPSMSQSSSVVSYTSDLSRSHINGVGGGR
jgi:hypothetical protein